MHGRSRYSGLICFIRYIESQQRIQYVFILNVRIFHSERNYNIITEMSVSLRSPHKKLYILLRHLKSRDLSKKFLSNSEIRKESNVNKASKLIRSLFLSRTFFDVI